MRLIQLGFGVWLTLVAIGCGPKTDATTSARTEERYLVETVAVDLVRMAAIGAGKTPLSSSEISVERFVNRTPPAYRIELSGGKSAEISVTTHVLDPKIYEPLAKVLAEVYPAKADAAPYTPQAAEVLSGFRVENFIEENKRISAFLSAHPASPAGQRDAAVLLGAFAMRDNSAIFWDPLAACARATALLAYADLLEGRQGKSSDALLGNLLIGLVVDTKALAQRQIEELAKAATSRPGLKAWVNAARYRNTRDWRPPLEENGASLLERIEKFRSACDAAGTGRALDELSKEKTEPPALPDWARIVMQSSSGVADGHRFTPDFVGAELGEAALVLGRTPPKSLEEAKALATALNIPATPIGRDEAGKWEVAVIDPAMWAQNAQRQISHAVESTWDFLANSWGVSEQAAEFWSTMSSALSDMELFPAIALLRNCPSREMQPYLGRLKELIDNHPELVPDDVWFRGAEPRYSDILPKISDDAAAWFTPPLLTGTAYRYYSRRNRLPGVQSLTLEQLEPIYSLAPLQQAVVVDYINAKFHGGASGEELERVAGPMLEYCLPVVRAAAKRAGQDKALRERFLIATAKISPDAWDEVAEFYLKIKDLEKAAQAYQSYVDLASDRVGVANECGWLVDYYYTHGQPEKAVEIAKMAAEVYSYRGLETYASLMERMNKLEDAEQTYKNIAERYEDWSALYLFYKRQQSYGRALGAKALEMEKAVFPRGIEEVTVASFTGAPKRGVVINEENDVLRTTGLNAGDIIVAFDGKRVETMEQYFFIRALSENPTFRLIAYHKGEYKEYAVSLKDRRFGVDMATLE